MQTRVFGCLIVQNEADILREQLDHLASLGLFERIFFFDLGSTDGTFSIAREYAGLLHEPTALTATYSNRLRMELLLRNRHLYRDGDWLTILDVDEFYAGDPREVLDRADAEGADSAYTVQVQYYLTVADAAEQGAEDAELPVRARRRHYLIDWSELRFFKYLPSRREGPVGSLRPCRTKLLNRHYQYRSPDQIEMRIRTRIANREKTRGVPGASPWAHVFSEDWRDYVVPARLLHRDDGGALRFGLPEGVADADYAASPMTRELPGRARRIEREWRAMLALPAAGPRPATVVTAVEAQPLELLELGVEEAVAGAGFNVQPDGRSALWLRCRGARPGVVVLFGGLPLDSVHAEGELVTASLPPETLVSAGTREIRVAYAGEISNALPFRVLPADDAPLVSIVIPCFDQAQFLRESIESARAQSLSPVEIIVVNDGSTDETAELLANEPGVIAIHQPNGGLARARNAGLARARGAFVLFLDADDRLLPDALERLASVLRGDPSLAFVSGLSRYMTAAGTPIEWMQKPLDRPAGHAALLREAHIWTPGAVLFRRSRLVDAGGFRTGMDGAADYDLYLRMSASHPVREITEPVVLYRRHESSMSRDDATMFGQVMRVRHQHRPPRGSPFRGDFAAGVRGANAYYGRRVLQQAAVAVANRNWRQAAASVGALARWSPSSLARLVRGIRMSGTLTFTVGDVRADLARASGTDGGSLALRRVVPDHTKPGVGFNVQPDGSSALSVECEGADEDTVVMFGAVPLETTYAGPGHLTASVPTRLYAEPGTHEIRLVGPAEWHG